MVCNKCGKEIGTEGEMAYEVRIGYADENETFIPEEDVGYYCSDCLKEGV